MSYDARCEMEEVSNPSETCDETFAPFGVNAATGGVGAVTLTCPPPSEATPGEKRRHADDAEKKKCWDPATLEFVLKERAEPLATRRNTFEYPAGGAYGYRKRTYRSGLAGLEAIHPFEYDALGEDEFKTIEIVTKDDAHTVLERLNEIQTRARYDSLDAMRTLVDGRVVLDDATVRQAVVWWAEHGEKTPKTLPALDRSDLRNPRRINVANPRHISYWDVSGVTDMRKLFQEDLSEDYADEPSGDFNKVVIEDFDEDLSRWRVENVTDMSFMFFGAKEYNSPLNSWDVGRVTDMTMMFAGALNFNQSLSLWNVENVTSMDTMFNGAISFNQNLSTWDVSKVTDMRSMFANAKAFDQDLSSWRVSDETDVEEFVFEADAFTNGGKPFPSWLM